MKLSQEITSKVPKQHKSYLVILLLLTAWFYWFQYRPVRIRRGCVVVFEETGGSLSRKNNAYRRCLAKKGLKPESLVVSK